MTMPLESHAATPTKVRVLRWVLRPTPEQEKTLYAWESAQRRLWNLALEQHSVWEGRPRADRARASARVQERAAAVKAAKDAGLPPPPEPPSIDDTAARWLRPDWVSQCADLTPLREDPTLAAVPRAAQSSLLKTLDESCTAARKGIRKWPRFKRRTDPCGMTFPVVGSAFRASEAPPPGERKMRPGWCDVAIPKLGDVRARCPVAVTGAVIQMRVVRRADRWFLFVWQRLPDRAPVAPEHPRVVGINRGVVELLATSDGLRVPGVGIYEATLDEIAATRTEAAALVAAGSYDKAAKRRINETLQALHKSLREIRARAVEGIRVEVGSLAEKIAPTVQSAKLPGRVAAAQREADRLVEARKARQRTEREATGDTSLRVWPSANEKAARLRVARLHADGAERRLQRSHGLSKAIVQRGDVLVFDGLALVDLTKSAKGTVDEPGEDVARKSELNRKMLDGGLGQTQVFTAYKAADRGGVVMALPAVNISIECPVCGLTDARNHPSAAVFRCVGCGHETNANVLAAAHLARRYAEGLRPTEKRAKVSIAKRGKRKS